MLIGAGNTLMHRLWIIKLGIDIIKNYFSNPA